MPFTFCARIRPECKDHGCALSEACQPRLFFVNATIIFVVILFCKLGAHNILMREYLFHDPAPAHTGVFSTSKELLNSEHPPTAFTVNDTIRRGRSANEIDTCAMFSSLQVIMTHSMLMRER